MRRFFSLPGRGSGALQVRNFRIYFIGSLLSVSGPWMQATGQAWLVLKLTNDPLALAVVASLQSLPIMLLSLLGGAVADRFSRRRLMMVTQGLAALQATLLGFTTVLGQVSIWEVYLLATMLGVINALDAPLRQALVGDIVPVDRLPNAIALSVMSQNLGRIVGPALGGLAIAALGVGSAFFLNALTFVTMIVALTMLRPGEMEPHHKLVRRGVLGEVKEGLDYAVRTPPVLLLLIATAFIGMFGQNFTTMVPLVSNYLVHATAAEFGLLNSCLGIGSLCAALWLTFSGAPSTRRVMVCGLVFGITLIAIGLATTLVLSGALFLVVGFAAVAFSASVNTALQIQSPPHMRGRFASMINLLIVGSSPIGAMLTGAIATGIAVSAAIVFNGAMCILGIAITETYRRRALPHAAPADAELASKSPQNSTIQQPAAE